MKKTLALLLVVFTLIAQLSMVTVFADGATVTVETVTAAAGETVELDVVLANCSPFCSLALEFDYNKEALTLLSIENGIADVKPTAGKDIATIPYNVLWDSAESVDGNGVILTLEFEVSANAVAGETYPVSVDYYKGRKGNYVDGEDCNYDMDEDFITYPLNLTYVSGGISIPAPVVPDTPTVPGAPEIPEFVAPSTAYVKVDDYAEYVEVGDVFTVDVNVGNSMDFCSLALEFDYDKDALKLLSIENGIADVKPTAGKDIATIPYNVLWDSAESVDPNGTILTLEFEVLEGAVAGEVYEIGVDYYKGRKGNYVDGEDCNYNMDEDFVTYPLNLSYYGGNVYVKPEGGTTPDVPTEPTVPEIPEFVAPSTGYVKVGDYAEFAKPGDVFEVDVVMGNSIDFCSLALEFDYDKDALTLLSITNGIADVKPTAGKDIATIPYNVLWDSADAVDGNGVILTLEFEVNAEAVTGVYEIGVDFYKGRKGNYVDGEDCNYNMDEDFNIIPLNLSYYGGIVSVKGAAAPVVPTEYALDAVVAGNGVTISAEGPAMEGKIIAALYNGDNKLAQVKIFDAAADLSHTFTKTGTKIKVMWWDGLLTAKPLCNCVEIPLN